MTKNGNHSNKQEETLRSASFTCKDGRQMIVARNVEQHTQAIPDLKNGRSWIKQRYVWIKLCTFWYIDMCVQVTYLNSCSCSSLLLQERRKFNSLAQMPDSVTISQHLEELRVVCSSVIHWANRSLASWHTNSSFTDATSRWYSLP